MAGTRKNAPELPRKEPDDKTIEGVAHDHGDGAKNHMHRLGDLPHLHGEDGKAVLLDGHGRPLYADETQVELPDPIPGSSAHDYYFNGDNDPAATDGLIERDRKLALGGNQQAIDRLALQVETTEIDRRSDIVSNGQPRPVAVSGAPGSRLADVSSFSSTLTLFGIPAELQDELTWAQIGKHALDSMIEEVIRTKRPADPALVSAALDAVDHIARARGLVKIKGAGS